MKEPKMETPPPTAPTLAPIETAHPTRKSFKTLCTRNVVVVILNIVAACILLFCCFYFFFSNPKMFWRDLKSYMFFSPILLVAGAGFVCFYIMNLVFHLEEKSLHLADSWDLVYKVVFSLTFMLLILRSFFGDFMSEPSINIVTGETIAGGTNLNVPIEMIVMGIISGLITWFTPPIRDNDNTEF